MQFHYKARSSDGTVVRGTIESGSRTDAEAVLDARGYLSARLKRSTDFSIQVQAFLTQFQQPKTSEVVAFLRQFAVMVSADVPVVQALRSFVQQTKQPALRAVLIDLVRDVESGIRLSDALASHPRVFTVIMIQLVRAGESSGNLEEVLEYLATQAENDAELRARVRGALVYPGFILGGLSVVMFILLTFVVPRLTSILLESGAELPLMTRALIAVSDIFSTWWWLIIIGTIAAAAGLRWSMRYPWMRLRWDSMTLRIPAIGSLIRDATLIRFSRSLEMLLRGGVDLVPALEIVRDMMTNAAYRAFFDRAIYSVRDGHVLVATFHDSPLVHPMATSLVRVGEETGQLVEALAKISTHFERVVAQQIRNIVTIIEPVVMIILGLVVGTMIAAIILPMYNLASAL